jgi:hypothetical protein
MTQMDTDVISDILKYFIAEIPEMPDDDDVYLDKLQTRGVKKSILYM